MSIEKMDALEWRVRKLIDQIHALQQTNSALEEELQHARLQLRTQEQLSLGWEEERTQIRERIERVLGDLEVLDGQSHDVPEGAMR